MKQMSTGSKAAASGAYAAMRSSSTAPGASSVSAQAANSQSADSTSEPSASTTQLTRKDSSAALVREGLNPKLSAVEATSQLKVLCRKFATLTEKVKEETKIREDAEKEVRQLRAIVEANNAPVIASCRAETQAFIKELQDTQESLRQELRLEKDKNDKLVAKALELEREKSQLIHDAVRVHDQEQQRAAAPPPEPQPRYSRPIRTTTEWDREQSTKIHDTLRVTIDELQDELARKDEELVSYRERLQRERAHVKTLEQELQGRDAAAQDEQAVLKEMEASLQEQRHQFAAIEQEMQASETRLEEEVEMRRTLEQQVETLNQVNAALDQRAKTLVRRLELNQGMVDELDDLKSQLREADVDKETLVRSIKDVKAQQYLQEVQWRGQLEQLRSEKLTLSSQISDLQGEIASLRTQNAMFSEWMLVRSENVAAAKQQPRQASISRDYDATTDSSTSASPATAARTRVRPLPMAVDTESNIYAHTSARCPLSPSKTRSMTTASPIKQPLPAYTRRSSVASFSTSSSNSSEDREVRAPSSTHRLHRHSSSKGSKLSDHERLRELMSRNRELQHRLQVEQVATRNLEQEISHMTTQHHE